jgi:regulator of replication initiation timing
MKLPLVQSTNDPRCLIDADANIVAVCDTVVNAVNIAFDIRSMHRENTALRKEVNTLRAQLGMERKYVEWEYDQKSGGCPT